MLQRAVGLAGRRGVEADRIRRPCRCRVRARDTRSRGSATRRARPSARDRRGRRSGRGRGASSLSKSCERRDDEAGRPGASRPIPRARRTVSSKSLRSKLRRRSGVAKPPKFRQWQSPAACTMQAVRRRAWRDRSAITVGRAAQEGEGRGLHAGVAQRQQLRQARPVLLDQDLDRIAALATVQPACARRRARLAQGAALFLALLDRQSVGLGGQGISDVSHDRLMARGAAGCRPCRLRSPACQSVCD